MGVAIEISDSLFAAAKREAQATQRSIPAQVEHWAGIGHAIEAILTHRKSLAFQEPGEILASLFPSAARGQEVHDLLMRIATSTDREAIKATLRAAGNPIYATDPNHPGLLVQVLPDGTRTLGRLVKRRFVPIESESTPT